NTGKSVQLRSLFTDPRLGLNGRLPKASKVREHFWLSADRSLYLRLTSPHEMNESLREFLKKIASKTNSGRWCVAAPLQPDRAGRMPDLLRTVEAVVRRFRPERVRVCILSPDRKGVALDSKELRRLFRNLWQVRTVECHCIDARNRTA